MSRDQRRLDRKQQGRKSASAPSSRRTPVRSEGRRFPVVPLAVAGGVAAVVLLLGYLIVQAGSGGSSLSAAEKAAQNDSPDLPGVYVPDQGRGHTGNFSAARPPTPFCDGVEHSDKGEPTPESSPTPAPTPTPNPEDHGTPSAPVDCYLSNPPSSGAHLGTQRNVDIGGGKIINIPPEPFVFPHDVEIPRDAIPHALEHASVFIGWNCADDDQACLDVVSQIEDIANGRIDRGRRVVMSKDTDLIEGTIGMAAWTRVYKFKYDEFDESKVRDFIDTHSCRVDWEGFC